MAPEVTVVKRRLENTVMYKSQFRRVKELTYSLLKWKIENFYGLKDDVQYTQVLTSLGWKLSLTKKKKVISVGIHATKLINEDISCCVMEDPAKEMKFLKLEEVEKGILKIEIYPRHYSGNSLLAKNVLLLGFKCIERYERTKNVRPSAGRMEMSCEEAMLKNLRTVYQNVIVPNYYAHDFVLCGLNYSIPVHRAILALRSTAFSKYFDENPFDVDKPVEDLKYDFLSCLLRFIYTGELEVMLKYGIAIPLFQSASDQGVPRLLALLVVCFQNTITKETARHLKKLGIETNVEELVKMADDCLAEIKMSKGNKNFKKSMKK